MRLDTLGMLGPSVFKGASYEEQHAYIDEFWKDDAVIQSLSEDEVRVMYNNYDGCIQEVPPDTILCRSICVRSIISVYPKQ